MYFQMKNYETASQSNQADRRIHRFEVSCLEQKLGKLIADVVLPQKVPSSKFSDIQSLRKVFTICSHASLTSRGLSTLVLHNATL